MWKLLRNLLLTALLLVGGSKLALWAAAHQQAQVLAQQLLPWGSLTWGGVSGDLDGTIRLRGVRFQPKAPLPTAPLDAAVLELRTRGPFWLAQRAVTHSAEVPEQLGISLIDARLPVLSSLLGTGEQPWFGDVSLVPFETVGCGEVKRLSDADYRSMRVVPNQPRFDLDYRYDSDERLLTLDVAIGNAAFSTLRLHADIAEYSSQLLSNKTAREAVRIGSATLNYHDHGYLAQRNKFCAQKTGVPVDTYIDQHIVALQEFLKRRHIVPAEGVVALYRQLLDKGGELQLLSLPNAEVSPASYASYDPEEVLRWLNLTARHNDEPPVLVKLFFLAAPVEALAGIDMNLMHDPLAEPDPTPLTVTADVEPIATPPQPPAASTTAPTPAANVALVKPTPVAAPRPLTPTPVAPPVATARVPAPAAVPQRPLSTPLREPAVVAAEPVLRVNPPREDPRVAGRASAPPPPPGSDAALVWQGAGIDRLPTNEAPVVVQRSYVVVAYDTLSQAQIGSRVAVITSGGKEIEGKIGAVDDSGLTLTILRESGQAQLFVERNRILEVRLQRRARG